MEAVGARRDIWWGEPVGPSTSLPHVYAIVRDVLGVLHTLVCYSWKDGQVITQERGKKPGTWIHVGPTNRIPGPVSPTPA